MRSAVALALVLATTSGACFPNNPRARRIAKYAEGGTLLTGILISGLAATTADCRPTMPGLDDDDCESTAKTWGYVGLGFIIAGVVGFIATVSTSGEDEKEVVATSNVPPPTVVQPLPQPASPDPAPAPPPPPVEVTPPTPPAEPTSPPEAPSEAPGATPPTN